MLIAQPKTIRKAIEAQWQNIGAIRKMRRQEYCIRDRHELITHNHRLIAQLTRLYNEVVNDS